MNDKKQKILIIGSGGREHAIGWKIAQSPMCGEIYFAPGNAGTLKIGINVDIKAVDIKSLIEFVKKEQINLTLAIPDDPLALGIVDEFQKEGLKIFGPTKSAARLESSKAYAKNFMQKYNLPTARFGVFSSLDDAIFYVKKQSLPIVIKASGLALGKGVIIAKTEEEAFKALEDILVKKVFGEAGNEVVIEEFLSGPEISIHAFSDGKSYSIFPTSQDHKRALEGDTGLNTGGMGTVAPLPRQRNGQAFVTEKLNKEIEENIVKATLSGMVEEKNIYSGVLYPGLLLTKDGPKILEYNARFGDPETETYMRLLETDLLEIINACVDQKLDKVKINWRPIFACTIMLVSGGYPGLYEKEKIIKGIEEAELEKDIVVFHAGTKVENNNLVTNGGRVLGVSAVGKNLEEALKKAYEAVNKISFEGMQYRKDIGKKAL